MANGAQEMLPAGHFTQEHRFFLQHCREERNVNLERLVQDN